MAYPTKLFEFVQMGIPVVATRTRVLGGLFGEGAVVFAEPTAQSIADGILWVHENPDEAESLARRARECCEPVSWERMKGVYTAAIEGLGGS
jgi:glycosyltransferase involved in cell wall biosynthesis